MLKKMIFNVLTPFMCMLTSAATPFQLSAGTCCPPVCCEEPCCEDSCCGSPWLRNAAMLAAALAAGAGGGALVASTSNRGRRGDTGPAGLGFTEAVVPPGQTAAGAPVTSLAFTFTTTAPIVGAASTIIPYVTTPDGRTFTGAAFTGLVGSTSTVTIPTGPFFNGVYNVGVIAPIGTTTIAGLVTVDLSNINGNATAPTLDDAGITVPASGVPLTDDTEFNAGFPYPPIP